MKETYLLYGARKIPVRVPDEVDILESGDSAGITDVEGTIRTCIEHPIGTRPLRELLREKKPRTVAITISDITRAVPNPVFLPHLLQTIEDSGVKRRDISIIVGTGMHRSSTPEEHVHLVGKPVYDSYRVVDHDSRDDNRLTRVSQDPPVSVNSEFLSADFKIVTGFIEPHFMAGYSGGRKGVCPALVNLETVQKLHGFETLASPLAKEGVLDGNPCHETALAVAKIVGVDFLFNVTLNREFRVSGVFCGDLEEAHERGCAYVSEHAVCSIEHPYDLVVTNGGGRPLDCNYYQTMKGACVALPALRKGSAILQVSECPEGIGSDNFRELLFRWNNDWRGFLKDIEANLNETRMEQWQLQMLCRVLENTGVKNLHFITQGIPHDEKTRIFCSPLKMRGTIAAAVEHFIGRYAAARPGARIALIPDGPYTILGKAGQDGSGRVSKSAPGPD